MSETKVKRPNLIEVWSHVLRSYLSKDMSDEGPMRNYNLYASSNAVYSLTNNVSFLYTIDGYPASIPIDLRKQIRDHASSNVRVSFITILEPTVTDWNSAKMRSRMSTWKKSKEELSADDVDEFDIMQKGSDLDNQALRKETLLYMYDAEQVRHRRMFVVPTMVIINGTRGVDFDDAVKKINNFMRSKKISFNRVEEGIEDYLRAFSPFSMEMTDRVRKEVGNSQMSDEMAARLSTYTQGRVGQGEFYMGTDVNSGYHVFKRFKRSVVDAENMLVTAETGGGKSYYIKSLILQFLGNSQYNGTIMDIEGDEYIPIANFISGKEEVVVLNMAEGQGSYFDPMEISMTGNPELDKDLYNISSACASSVYRAILSGIGGENKNWVDNILDQSIATAYARRGVRPAVPSTWANTKGMELHDVYGEMKKIKDFAESDKPTKSPLIESLRKNPQASNALLLCIISCSNYFEREDDLGNAGSKAHIFSNKITLNEIATCKLVLCSFGMKGRSPNSVDQVQMALSQIFAAHISHLRSIFSKAQGLFNFKIWEEFQRWGQFPGSKETINTTLTGGRKLGDVNIIATNKLSELLDNDIFGILENTTSYAIGAIGNSNTREKVCDRLTIQEMLPELNKIQLPEKPKGQFSLGSGEEDFGDEAEERTKAVSDTDSKYKKAFLVSFDKTDKAMVRMELPAEVADSDLMMTGVKLSSKVRGSVSVESVDWA